MTVSYVGFDSRAHVGTLVVNRRVTRDVEQVFRRLYTARFPIHRMQPIARYGGSDDRSMAADNTSAFNCRYAVAPGPKRWSAHAYGEAIDVNTVENPYLEGGRILPPAGRAYARPLPVPARHGRRGRRARARVRVSRLALGRTLDRLARLAAFLEDRRLTGGVGLRA